MYNFKIIECVLINLIEFILNISGEFKIMHFTSSNLLHNFPNGKYMLFSLCIYIYKIHMKNTGQLDPTCNLIDPNTFLTRLKWSVFDLWPVWPAIRLTRTQTRSNLLVFPCLLKSIKIWARFGEILFAITSLNFDQNQLDPTWWCSRSVAGLLFYHLLELGWV